MWTSQFGAPPPPPSGGSPTAGVAQAPMEAVAALRGGVTVDSATTVRAESVDAAGNGAAMTSDVRVRGFEVFQRQSEGSWRERHRESSIEKGAVRSQLEVALRTWLSQAREQDDPDDDAPGNDLCHAERARDAYFESFEGAFTGVGDEIAPRKFARFGYKTLWPRAAD
jgi:hypothetical protein